MNLEFIKKIAQEKPVLEWEKQKNNKVFNFQRDRNPFVDHPEWINFVNFDNAFK